MIKVAFGLLGGIAGALIAAPIVAMATAQIVARLHGASDGNDTLWSGAKLAGLAGLLLGFGGGIWLVLRQAGRWAGTAVTWLWVGAFLIAGCLIFVAFS